MADFHIDGHLIQTVVDYPPPEVGTVGSYKVNGGIFVPKNPSLGAYQAIQAWIAAGNVPADGTPGLAELVVRKQADLAAKRYAVETGGITVAGLEIATDRESQNLIAGAKAALADGTVSAPIKWKTRLGFVEVSASDINAVAAAVAGHVQACFAHEADLAASIEAAATTDELGAIDISAGWPT